MSLMINKMMISRIEKKFKSLEIMEIESAFICAYIRKNNLVITNSIILSTYLEKVELKKIEGIVEYILQSDLIESLDDLIKCFELLIINDDKKNRGMVYTPYPVKEYILESVMVQDTPPCIIDPACGCGSFLVTAAQKLKDKYLLSYKEIFSNYIYGVDIDKHSITKANILFELLLIESGDPSTKKNMHLICGNSLELLSGSIYLHKFDIVIGNPPYVRAKNIEDCVKESLRKWSVCAGNIDLYIPFYQLGIQLLKEEGKLGYISPNTFLQSVNGRKLRTYLYKNESEIKILDFRETQAFKEITHYACICIIDKSKKTRIIKYALLNGHNSLYQYDFTEYSMETYLEDSAWRFGNEKIDKCIACIEKQPYKLEDFKIRNGLATLKNDLFIFDPYREDEKYYYRTYGNNIYKIEKDICIDIAKPNVMRNEKDLEDKIEKGIFPYIFSNGKYMIIPENSLSKMYPEAYAFLLEYKNDLLNRDKGKTEKYPAWYAYGRTQGMANQGKKLLIPYMAEKGVAILSLNEELLFYCGYAVFSDDVKILEILKRIIESKVFTYYILNTSKPYSKGYMSLAKNYIKNFGIPLLDDKQTNKLLELKTGDELESYIADLYGLELSEIN